MTKKSTKSLGRLRISDRFSTIQIRDRISLDVSSSASLGSTIRNGSMSGWMAYDNSGQVYKLPEFALGSGATVTIYTGERRDSAANLYIGHGSPIWNNENIKFDN